MNTTIILLTIFCAATILIGKYFYGRIFNHISLYSLSWTFVLLLGELKLLFYYPLENEVWTIMIGGWICFIVGSITHSIAYKLYHPADETISSDFILESDSLNLLKWIILSFSMIAIISAIVQWSYLLNKYGSFAGVMINGNLVYSTRVSEGGGGRIPYLDSVALAMSLLAGIYTYFNNRVTIVSILPLVIVIVISIASMGRAQILISLILFIVGYQLPKIKKMNMNQKYLRYKFRRIIGFIFLVSLVVGGAEIIRSNRSTNESYVGATRTLKSIRGFSIITPSIYLYFSNTPYVFNEYLKGSGEEGLISGYTFAPLWRGLSNFGFDTYVQNYQPFYNTPVGSNTGTYLRELHTDFGIAGVFIGPYVLGFLCSFYWFRWVRNRKMLDLTIMAHLYVIVGMSFLCLSTQLGYYLISLLTSIMASLILDKKRALK